VQDFHALTAPKQTLTTWAEAIDRIRAWYQDPVRLAGFGVDTLFKYAKIVPADAQYFIAEERVLKASTSDV